MAAALNPLEFLLRLLERRAAVPPEDRAAFLAMPYTVRSVSAGAYVVREGESPEHCCMLVSGFAFRQRHTADGLRQIMSLHIPGEALDFQNVFLDVTDHSVQMLTRSEVAFIPRPAVRELVHSRAAIAHAILVYTLVEAAIFREWVVNVGRRVARARMAHLLCEFAVRMHANGLGALDGYELPITQEQLADALGLTPVHVNRTLKGLEASGLIVRNKRNIRFPDVALLRQEADFTERYLHLRVQSPGQGLG